MPLYELKCPDCNKTTERITKIGTKEVACECGAIAYKDISLCSFKLRGGGWYSDGYTGKAKVDCDAALAENRKVADATEKQVVCGPENLQYSDS